MEGRRLDIDITGYFDTLSSGEPERLRELFAASPFLNDPQAGKVAGPEALGDFIAGDHEWLAGSRADLASVTDTERRVVAEFILHLGSGGQEIALPVAIAADKAEGAYGAIRVYYSMWPLLGHHELRSPILCKDDNLALPDDAVGRYHDALTRGDLEDILDTFEDDGYAREPAGGEYVYEGKERLRDFYALLFSGGGGIILDHCLLADNGVRAALEYNAISWGETELKPQAGIAVYERGASGLLHAARIYDDVEPPVGE